MLATDAEAVNQIPSISSLTIFADSLEIRRVELSEDFDKEKQAKAKFFS